MEHQECLVHICIEKRRSINFCFHTVDWRAGVPKNSSEKWAKMVEWPEIVQRVHGSGFKRLKTSQAPFTFEVLFLVQHEAQEPSWVFLSHQNCFWLMCLGMGVDCPSCTPQQVATSITALLLCFSSWPENHSACSFPDRGLLFLSRAL